MKAPRPDEVLYRLGMDFHDSSLATKARENHRCWNQSRWFWHIGRAGNSGRSACQGVSEIIAPDNVVCCVNNTIATSVRPAAGYDVQSKLLSPEQVVGRESTTERVPLASPELFPPGPCIQSPYSDFQHHMRGQIFLWNLAAQCVTLTPRCNVPAFVFRQLGVRRKSQEFGPQWAQFTES